MLANLTKYANDIDAFWGKQWKTSISGVDITDRKSVFKFKYFLRQALMQLPQGAKVCEVGSGNCQWLFLIKAFRPDLQISGIDISDLAVQLGSERGVPIIKADTRDIPVPDGTYDLVYSWGVIEHMQESALALREQYRIAKHFCLVDVPYKHSLPAYLSRYREIRRRKLSEYDAMIEFGRVMSQREFLEIVQSVLQPGDSYRLCYNYLFFPNILKVGWLIDCLCPAFVRQRYAHNIGAIIRKRV